MSHIINILAGPTAVGKTELALDWAAANGAEIVNADALLFYRGMDIGTAKPTAEERAQVPHHLINIRPVRQAYSIKEYVEEAQRAVADIFARGHRVLVVGGSGFYLKSYFAPVSDDLDIAQEIRAHIRAIEDREGLGGLLRELDPINPKGTGKLHRENPRRVARALERCLASGKTLGELENEFATRPGPFDAYPKRSTLLLRSNHELHPRLAARTQAMIADGLIDEVRRLRAEGLEANPTAANAIGYRETRAWLDAGSDDQTQLAEAINRSTRQLIAKQRKWFRTQFPADRVLEGAQQSADGLF